jgi:succinate-semialdehyde dehydrogenase/glutarate-semialdehyde dehydrogenase
MAEHRLLIGGKWLDGASSAPATSPSSGVTFGTVAFGDRTQADQAVEAAAAAFPAWSAMSAFDRAAVCAGAAEAVSSRRDELAHALTEDQGKPLLAEAFDEVDELVGYFHMAGEEAKRLTGSVAASTVAGRRALTRRVPLGVVGVVTPWNWPYTMGAEIFAPAFAAGNTIVWVPAPTTAACSALLTEVVAPVFEAACPGAFNFVSGLGAVVGDAVAGHRLVAGVGFIGSVSTGGLVAVRAAGKAQILELGGNGPMVILDDADIALAAEAALEAAYMCAGQSCTAGERFLVHAAVRQEFVEAVVEATRAQVHLGDPFDPETTMGPLNNEPTAAKFDRHVADALARGARVCFGGRRAPGFATELFVEPTVLDGVTPEMAIASEETFGPVVPVVEIRSAAEALDLTNSSPFGLTAAIFTDDLERGLAFAEAARAGWVNINASTNVWETHLPFGGRAGSVSGRGRVGGSSVMDTFTEPQTVLFPAPRSLSEQRRTHG